MKSPPATSRNIGKFSIENLQSASAKTDLERNKKLKAFFDTVIADSNAPDSILNSLQSKTVDTPELSHDGLIQLSERTNNALANAAKTPDFPEELANAIFNNLERNTEQRLKLWKQVKPPVQYLSNSDPEELARRAVVLHRFTDIPLIENGAIQDSLRTEKHGVNQFLHANLMAFAEGQQFIASQKPYKGEIPGFWHMVLQRKIPVIVDLTNSRDNKNDIDYSFGKERNHGKTQCGPLTIALPENKTGAIIRNFPPLIAVPNSAKEKIFSVSQDGTSHDVIRIHFKDWPDHGVVSPDTLIALADQIEAASKGSDAPVLIHCRAGVGRTGTLISFIVARKLIAKALEQGNGPVTNAMIGRILLSVIAEGRLGRGPQFVQNPEQFHLAANALARYFNTRNQASSVLSPPRKSSQVQRDHVRRTLQAAQAEIKQQVIKNNDAPLRGASRHVHFDSNPQIHLISRSEEEGDQIDLVEMFNTAVDPDRRSDGITKQTATAQGSPRSGKSPPISANVGTPNVGKSAAVVNADVIDSNAANSNAANTGMANPNVTHTGTKNSNTMNLDAVNSNTANTGSEKVDLENPPDPVDVPHSVSAPVARLWLALSNAVTEPPATLNDDTIEQDVTGLPCIAATAVSVMINGERKHVHANHVCIPQLSTEAHPDSAAHRYIAGQSPQHFTAAERILLKAIESREGIFQLVSPMTHNSLHGNYAEEEKKLSVAPILMQLLAKQARGEEIIIGNRYRVIPVKRENKVGHLAAYDLTIRSLNGDQEFTIPITQIGLKFDNAVLKEEDIRAANSALDQHLQHGIASNAASGTEPIIISRKGVGRNATLIVYHEILQ